MPAKRRKIMVYDEEERERIRRALKQYKHDHGIGVPRLRELMKNALDLSEWQYLDISSLQRFIRNDVRTDDEKVHRYRKFLEIVSPPPAEEELGAALAHFFAVDQRDLGAIAGRYLCEATTPPAVQPGPVVQDGDGHVIAHSEATMFAVDSVRQRELVVLENSGAAAYLRASYHREQQSCAVSEHENPWAISETQTGLVVAGPQDSLLMLLRNYIHSSLYALVPLKHPADCFFGTFMRSASWWPAAQASPAPWRVGTAVKITRVADS